ncbi:hypothetical protein [Leisingera sp. JC11]
MVSMIECNPANIEHFGGKQPAGWRNDPRAMQIAKPSYAARKAARR